MNKSDKIIVRTAAFLLSTVVSVSAFALFSSWAWTHLDPAQQDAIGSINTSWIAAQRDGTSVSGEQRPAAGNKSPETPTTAAAHVPSR